MPPSLVYSRTIARLQWLRIRGTTYLGEQKGANFRRPGPAPLLRCCSSVGLYALLLIGVAVFLVAAHASSSV